MTTETKAITPEQAGLSLAVLSGPRGEVREDWPCIAYTCQLSDSRRRVIWTGDFRLGVGHVKPKGFARPEWSRTTPEQQLLEHWQSKPGSVFTDKALWADVAAKLAKAQKVTPKLNDVCASLLMDGSAFFDGQRFEEWAGDLGYSDDSIKAKEIFETCDQIGRDLSRALSRDEIAGLREWASQY
jgi:hypothetical protein